MNLTTETQNQRGEFDKHYAELTQSIWQAQRWIQHGEFYKHSVELTNATRKRNLSKNLRLNDKILRFKTYELKNDRELNQEKFC